MESNEAPCTGCSVRFNSLLLSHMFKEISDDGGVDWL